MLKMTKSFFLFVFVSMVSLHLYAGYGSGASMSKTASKDRSMSSLTDQRLYHPDSVKNQTKDQKTQTPQVNNNSKVFEAPKPKPFVHKKPFYY